jgi:hypothetical protein
MKTPQQKRMRKPFNKSAKKRLGKTALKAKRAEAKRAKAKLEKVDGLGPKDIKRIRSALRGAWQWNHARQLVIKRCLVAGGFSKCELCKKKSPKVFVDHIEACGEVTQAHYIARMFRPSSELQGLCQKCHSAKTKQEREDAKW